MDGHVNNSMNFSVVQEKKKGHPDDIPMSDMGYFNPVDHDTMMNPLQMDKYKSWYDVIKRDDLDRYENIMGDKSEAEKLAMLNKKFLYCVAYSKKLKKLRKDNAFLEFETPLCVAAGSGARRCFVRMLKDGADVLRTDIDCCNVIHAMIRAASDETDTEHIYVEMLQAVLKLYDTSTLKKLLFHEDSLGFRPIEAAARWGTYGLFRVIFETREVYFEVIDEVGMCTYAEYDIDDYENTRCRKRELRSPIRFIQTLDQAHAKSFIENEIHEIPAIKKWINRKLLHSLPWMIIWFILRVLYLMTHIVFDPKLMANRTLTCSSDPDHLGCRGAKGAPPIDTMRLVSDISVYTSWVILAFDLLEFLAWLFERDRWRVQGGLLHPFKKEYVSYTMFYRVCMILLASVSLINFYYAQKSEPDTINIIKAVSLPLVLMCLLYMLELFPLLGIFAITLQKMCIVMIKFGFITATLWFIYAYFFMISIQKDDNFDNLGQSIYSLFLIDSGNFNFTNVNNYIMIAHISYFYISAILLLNYLIAVMATLSDDISKQKKLCQTLRRLDMALVVDDRIGRWIRKLWYMCHKKRRRIRLLVKNPHRFKRIKLQVEVNTEEGVMI